MLTCSIDEIFSGSSSIEPPGVAEAGIVDQRVDDDAAFVDELHQFGRASRLAEVGGNHGDLGARGMKLRGQRLHRLAAARHQHQIVAVLGGFARQLGADAARRAGDERNGTG